jgi:peptidoglycan/xylan/chitin deacetylase (PgdA/CDA1 family)
MLKSSVTHSAILSAAAALRRTVWPMRRGNVILMYHRITRTNVDPWALCVDPNNFSQQMEALNRIATPIPLTELPDADPQHPSVAVTFDDGYLDNLEITQPILGQHGIPATIFISTGYIGKYHGYWWDELEAIFLHPGALPARGLKLSVAGQNYNWEIDPTDLEYQEADCATHRPWIAWKQPPPTSRHAVFFAVWSLLREAEAAQREDGICRIRQWAGASERHTPVRCMTPEELREVSRGARLSVGAHTISHSRLSQLSESSQWTEISESKSILEQILGRPVYTFSYPFGGRNDYTDRTVEAVRAAGYRLACSNFEGTVGPKSDRFQLPRLHVENWNGDDFATWLRSYLIS